MKLLHIDSGILGTASVSRQLSAEAVAEWRARYPSLEVTYRDLVAQPLAHLAGDQLFAAGADASQRQRGEELAAGDTVLQEFLDADVVVIGAPMYNFSIPEPAQGLDRPHPGGGQDLRLWRQGPRAWPATARDHRRLARRLLWRRTPAAACEHLETYLRSVFGFIGIVNPEVIIAEGIRSAPEHREKSAGERPASRDQSPRGVRRSIDKLPAVVKARRQDRQSANAVERRQYQTPGTPAMNREPAKLKRPIPQNNTTAAKLAAIGFLRGQLLLRRESIQRYVSALQVLPSA